MSHAHSFFIPDTEHLIDISSFLSYLHTVISVFHECLFCGCERGSQAGIQDHMRGKGHCKVDFEAENELWEFWEFDGDEDGDDGSKEDKEKRKEIRLGIDEDELRLPSGKILGHRSLHARYARQHRARGRRSSSPQQQQLLTEGESGTLPMETNESKDQRVAIRKGTETSMIGVPEPQQRALMAVEKKMDALQARSSNEYQAGVERGGNRQKTFKVTSIGKKRGGLEKRNG
jgi:pre-60S factor REI1